jgi:hypothetical protein
MPKSIDNKLFKKISANAYHKLTYIRKHTFVNMTEQEIDNIINCLNNQDNFCDVHKGGLILSNIGEWNGIGFYYELDYPWVGSGEILKVKTGEFVVELNTDAGGEDTMEYYTFNYSKATGEKKVIKGKRLNKS